LKLIIGLPNNYWEKRKIKDFWGTIFFGTNSSDIVVGLGNGDLLRILFTSNRMVTFARASGVGKGTAFILFNRIFFLAIAK